MDAGAVETGKGTPAAERYIEFGNTQRPERGRNIIPDRWVDHHGMTLDGTHFGAQIIDNGRRN